MLPWLAIPPAMAALRFRWAVTMALCGPAALLIVGVGIGVDPAGARDDPVTMIAALVMLANIAGVTTALMRGELEHRDRAVIDPLTGLLNRVALESRIPKIEQQARLTGGSVCLVLFDVDRFKRVNDTHGHERGDAALKEAAYAMRKALRSFELRPAGLDLTLSAGVAAAVGEQVTYDDLFRAADAALLRAKREGRNRVIVAGRARAVAA